MIIDKILNPFVLLLVNVGIIVATEMSGTYFYENGAIHAIALIFIILALTRFLVPYTISDKTARKFVLAALGSLIIFAASHFIEFLSHHILGKYTDATFANVANFYIISLFLIIIGVEFILNSYYSRPKAVIWVSVGGILISMMLTIAFFLNSDLISLEPVSLAPYIYVVGILGVGTFGFVNLLEAERIMPVIKDFSRYLAVIIALIVLAALPGVLYEVLQDYAGWPEYQVIYFSHFTFYMALSAMFLAFGQPLKSVRGSDANPNNHIS